MTKLKVSMSKDTTFRGHKCWLPNVDKYQKWKNDKSEKCQKLHVTKLKVTSFKGHKKMSNVDKWQMWKMTNILKVKKYQK